jgi:hypothetical protein
MFEHQTLVLVIVIGTSTYLASYVLTIWKRSQLCAKHGCQPARALPQRWYTFGFDVVIKMMTWSEHKVFLERFTQLLQDYSHTFSHNITGTSFLWTMAPENAQAMMGSKSGDFEVSTLRIAGFQPYIGEAMVYRPAMAQHGHMVALFYAPVSRKRSSVTRIFTKSIFRS